MTKKSALSNSDVLARQPKKRGPKEHDEQHLENASSRRRLPHRAPAAATAAVMPLPDPQLLPPPLPPCCFRCRATAITVLPQPPSPSPCCCLLAGCHLPLKVMREMGFHSETWWVWWWCRIGCMQSNGSGIINCGMRRWWSCVRNCMYSTTWWLQWWWQCYKDMLGRMATPPPSNNLGDLKGNSGDKK